MNQVRNGTKGEINQGGATRGAVIIGTLALEKWYDWVHKPILRRAEGAYHETEVQNDKVWLWKCVGR